MRVRLLEQGCWEAPFVKGKVGKQGWKMSLGKMWESLKKWGGLGKQVVLSTDFPGAFRK